MNGERVTGKGAAGGGEENTQVRGMRGLRAGDWGGKQSRAIWWTRGEGTLNNTRTKTEHDSCVCFRGISGACQGADLWLVVVQCFRSPPQ